MMKSTIIILILCTYRYISRILMQLMSGTQSEETTVEVVEEKSGSFRMLPALPSSGVDEPPSTLIDSSNMCVFFLTRFHLLYLVVNNKYIYIMLL